MKVRVESDSKMPIRQKELAGRIHRSRDSAQEIARSHPVCDRRVPRPTSYVQTIDFEQFGSPHWTISATVQ
ncbi:MAG: hypothetical protein ACRD2I_18070, partial [Vicinamibacterales bacterium]